MNRLSPPRSELAEVLNRLRHTFFALAAFSGVINLLLLAPALYMLQVYDRVLVSSNVTTLLMLTLLLLGLYLLMALLEVVRSVVLIRVGNRLDMALNRRVFGAAFERNLRRAGGNPAQALQDLAQVRQFLTGSGLFAFFDAPWTPLYLGVAFLIHPVLGVITLVGSLLLFGLAYLTEVATRQPLAPARAAYISGASRFVRIALQSLILGVGALLVIDGKITPGMMIACSILTGRALGPVEQAIATWKQLLACRVAWGRLSGLLEDFPERAPAMPLPRPLGQVAVEGGLAAAPGTVQTILRGVTFSLAPGEALGVIGPSAAGKSTLARLLVGVWPAQAGKVRLDGADVFLWNKEQLGPWIGYLPQDVELFEGSIDRKS